MSKSKIIEWVLRVTVAGEFIGHGVFSLQQKVGWIEYFEAVGFSAESALVLMPIIGAMDLFLAFLILVKPIKIAILWMAFWGFWTALLRPIAGEPVWDFIERSANWGAPLALLLLLGWPRSLKEWFK